MTALVRKVKVPQNRKSVGEELYIIKKHQNKTPVDMIPLARDLGIEVYYTDMPNDFSGRIEKNYEMGGDSGYVIIVNETHASTRRRFTMAHEIAHFILHREYIGDGITDDGLYRSGLPNSMEREANSMAADILMPQHLLDYTMASGINTIEALADEFKVSKDAMSIRVLGVPYD